MGNRQHALSQGPILYLKDGVFTEIDKCVQLFFVTLLVDTLVQECTLRVLKAVVNDQRPIAMRIKNTRRGVYYKDISLHICRTLHFCRTTWYKVLPKEPRACLFSGCIIYRIRYVVHKACVIIHQFLCRYLWICRPAYAENRIVSNTISSHTVILCSSFS